MSKQERRRRQRVTALAAQSAAGYLEFILEIEHPNSRVHEVADTVLAAVETLQAVIAGREQ